MENNMQNTTHKERKKKTKTLRLFNPSVYDRNTSAKIQSIDLNEEYTRIDFKYTSSQEIYQWWMDTNGKKFIYQGYPLETDLSPALCIKYTHCT